MADGPFAWRGLADLHRFFCWGLPPMRREDAKIFSRRAKEGCITPRLNDFRHWPVKNFSR
jgi:hypothetical protein